MIFAFFQGGMVERVGWTLVHSLWQFALIGLFAAMLAGLMRRWSAAARYQLLLGLFVLMVTAPVVTWVLLPTSDKTERFSVISDVENGRFVNVPSAAPANDPLANANTTGTSPDIQMAADASLMTSDNATSTSLVFADWRSRAFEQLSGWLRPWLGGFVVVWCVGVAAFALRPLIGWLAVRRLRSVGTTSPPAKVEELLSRLLEKMSLTRSVRLLESTLAASPMVIGYIRPVILLPVSIVANMPVAQLESILVHELAHIQRHDYLINLLQTLSETLFFYHPAIWWLSRRIRIEREHCCDDTAVAMIGDKVEYGRALLSLEELRGSMSSLALGARDGSLVARVRRMLHGDSRALQACDRGVWLACMAALSIVLGVLLIGNGVKSFASTSTPEAEQDPAAYATGGEASDGLVLRVISVSSKTDEQKPAMGAPIVTKFTETADVTLVAELKNVSDKPIKLFGVRYGEGVSAPSIGKSNTRRFGPILFAYEYRTKDGKLVEPPAVQGLGNPFLELSGAQMETIAPGATLVCALKPLETHYEAKHWLPAGDYTLQVSYRGVNESTQTEMNKHWPKMGFTGLWSGKVSSNGIPLTVADAPMVDLVWGPTTNGLQAAIELRDGDTYRPESAPAPPRNEFPLGAAVSSIVHVKNVSDKPISFWTEEFRQGDSIEVTDASGKVTKPGVPFFSGWAVMSKFTLKPGQVAAVYSNIGSGMMASTKTRGRGGPTLSPEAISIAGKYSVEIELNFGSLQTKDKDGNPVPGPSDFSGKLKTGKTPFLVRERKAADDPPKFNAKVQFKSKSDEPIRGGMAQIREVQGEELLSGRFEGNSIELKNVEGKPVYVTVRASGFEEETFYDVALADHVPAVLEVSKAKPTTMKITAKGKPVAGAKVRHFVRSKAKAGSGPYPMKGFEGDVWATSNAAGEVVLDTLQLIDPSDAKLGENVYWFFIEPPAGLAGRMVGPIKAGQELGEITLGELLTVRGEVRATKAELDSFVAEWDQPEAIVHGDGSKNWDYAVSQNLSVNREGERMTFELTGLRPGRLRFVSNFQGQSSGHEYSKRTVGPTDVVLELELKGSLDDVVLTSKKP